MGPAIDTLTAPFIHVAFDQIASIIAKSTYPYRGQTRLSLTVRCPMLHGTPKAAQHSDHHPDVDPRAPR